MRQYLISFANTLDPNYSGFPWPKWMPSSQDLLTFEDGLVPLTIGQDTYRQVSAQQQDQRLLVYYWFIDGSFQDAMNFLVNLTLKHPL